MSCGGTITGMTHDAGPDLRLTRLVTAVAVVVLLTTVAAQPAAADRGGTAEPTGRVIDTAVGTGDRGNSGDGGPARQAAITAPSAVTTAPDGTLYLVSGLTVRAVDPKTHVIRTVAGTGEPGYSGDGGAATKAKLGGTSRSLEHLGGIAVGPDGVLYIADSGNHRVRAVDPRTGTIRTVAGNGRGRDADVSIGDGRRATRAELYYPNDVAVGPDGTLYVADEPNGRIRAVNPRTKRISTVAGAVHSGGKGSRARSTHVRPVAIAVAGDGRVYFAEHALSGDRVRVVDSKKDTIETVAGEGSPPEPLDMPGDLAIHGNTLYVLTGVGPTSSGPTRVYAFDLERRRLTPFAGGGPPGVLGDGGKPTDASLDGDDGATGVAVGPTGAVYVADTGNNRVRVVHAGGSTKRGANPVAGKRISTLLGSGMKWTDRAVERKADEEDGVFYRDVHDRDDVDLRSPESVAVGRDGTVYVADTDNNRIRVLRPGDDEVRTLAGTAGVPDDTDEAEDGEKATDAFLPSPGGLALGPGHRLYFTVTGDLDGGVDYLDLDDNTVHQVGAFDDPADVAVDRHGAVYVAYGGAAGDGKVCRMKPSDDRCRTIIGPGGAEDATTGTQRVEGIALGPDGTVYVADAASFRVRAYDPRTRRLRTVAGQLANSGLSGDGGPGTSAQLGALGGMAVGPGGRLYLTEESNHRIRALDTRTGVLTTVAGTGEFSGDDDDVGPAGRHFAGGGFGGDGGRAGKAQLDSPNDVAVGPGGALYVADTGNERIRTIGAADVARGRVHPLRFVVPALVLVLAALTAWWFVRRRRRGRAEVG